MVDTLQLKRDFLSVFGEGCNPIKFVKAPGRINLIGEHTDYNNGFVLPVAIDRFIFIAGRKREDERIFIHAGDRGEEIQRSLRGIFPRSNPKWADYLLGVFKFLREENYPVKGAEIFFRGDIPVGKGLSSSAALEVATCYFLSVLFDFAIEPIRMAELCQRVENEFVGMPCGIMDQFVSLLGRKESALFLDCRDLKFSYVPVESSSIDIMIADSGVKRELTASPYKKRKNECEIAVKLLKRVASYISSLRDLTMEVFGKYEDSLPETLKKRVRHVVGENERVNRSVEYLKAGEMEKFGQLMYESHASLRDDYEVSCRELDALVDSAISCEGVLGSRMTGAGFGGSTVSMVRKEKSEEVREIIGKEYYKKTGLVADIYICKIVDGVGEM
ncbi:MAG TPA: galactokinase [Candidatus Omnitrophica bacterium]|nr:galactokinase [Candidatus Omnitrophota bacterium]